MFFVNYVNKCVTLAKTTFYLKKNIVQVASCEGEAGRVSQALQGARGSDQ